MIADFSAPGGNALAAVLVQAAVARDTVVAVQAHTGLDRWANVAFTLATIVIAVALIVVAVAALAAALAARRMVGKVQAMMERMRVDVDPILKHAVSVSDNVDYISTSIRGDVQKLNETVAMATRRLNHASDLAEARINDFNALLEVVQEEAESLVVSTAATVRCVHVGAEAFRRFRDGGAEAHYDPYEGEPGEFLDDDGLDGDLDEDEDDLPPPRPRGRGIRRG